MLGGEKRADVARLLNHPAARAAAPAEAAPEPTVEEAAEAAAEREREKEARAAEEAAYERERAEALAAAKLASEASRAVEESSGRVRLALHFQPPRLSRAELPRIPRHFSGESRLGQADGSALVSAFAEPSGRGMHAFVGACEGDTRVAAKMFEALAALCR